MFCSTKWMSTHQAPVSCNYTHTRFQNDGWVHSFFAELCTHKLTVAWNSLWHVFAIGYDLFMTLKQPWQPQHRESYLDTLAHGVIRQGHETHLEKMWAIQQALKRGEFDKQYLFYSSKRFVVLQSSCFHVCNCSISANGHAQWQVKTSCLIWTCQFMWQNIRSWPLRGIYSYASLHSLHIHILPNSFFLANIKHLIEQEQMKVPQVSVF